MADVLLATCADYPDGDEDGALLLDALRAHGVRASWASWDDPGVDWSDRLVVLRSTWDYTLRREQFLAWARGVPRLINPYEVVAWNSDKTYLRDLQEAGVATVPTSSAAPGEHPALPASGEFVVKPSVGAGSRGAGRFAAGERAAALAHAQELHDAGRTVLVQPYLDEVDSAGETALVHLDGTFSHAIRKGAMLPVGRRHGVRSRALFVQENIAAREPSAAEIAVGERTLTFLRQRFGELAYARIDLLPSTDGPVVIEVEVTEPSLFLGFAAGAADRLAAAIEARS